MRRSGGTAGGGKSKGPSFEVSRPVPKFIQDFKARYVTKESKEISLQDKFFDVSQYHEELDDPVDDESDLKAATIVEGADILAAHSEQRAHAKEVAELKDFKPVFRSKKPQGEPSGSEVQHNDPKDAPAGEKNAGNPAQASEVSKRPKKSLEDLVKEHTGGSKDQSGTSRGKKIKENLLSFDDN